MDPEYIRIPDQSTARFVFDRQPKKPMTGKELIPVGARLIEQNIFSTLTF